MHYIHNQHRLIPYLRRRVNEKTTVHKYVDNLHLKEIKNRLRKDPLVIKFKDKIYKDENLPYCFNQYGLRSDEIDPQKDSIIYLGCSITEGVGLKLEHIWFYKLHQKLCEHYKKDLQWINAGCGGVRPRQFY